MKLNVLVFTRRPHSFSHQKREIDIAGRPGGVDDYANGVFRLPAIAVLDLLDGITSRVPQDFWVFRVRRITGELPKQVVTVTAKHRGYTDITVSFLKSGTGHFYGTHV